MSITKFRYPNLRLWRNDRDWSQMEAAAYLGISQTTYSRLERGTAELTGSKAKAIHAKTGVPVDVLVGLVEVAS